MIQSIHVNQIKLHITYKIPIKIIVLDFVGESQPTCGSADRITVANIGIPSPCSKLDSLAFWSRNQDVPSLQYSNSLFLFHSINLRTRSVHY